MAKFENLSELLSVSSSTRKYFLSLPVSLQTFLHEHYYTIRTSEQLHLTVNFLQHSNLYTGLY